jgi:hypothetical protein
LNPRKLAQRKELIEKAREGTVLELFAGRGNLSKAAFKPKARRFILVDADGEELAKALKATNGVETKAYVADNIDWCEHELKNERLSDLSYVDFDAFGSPAPAMKAFFENYKVKRPIYVGLTDGAGHYIGQVRYPADLPLPKRREKWIRQHYGVKVDGQKWNKQEQVRIFDEFMHRMGKEHGFKAERVNADTGGGQGVGKDVRHRSQYAIYLGYRLTPVGS